MFAGGVTVGLGGLVALALGNGELVSVGFGGTVPVAVGKGGFVAMGSVGFVAVSVGLAVLVAIGSGGAVLVGVVTLAEDTSTSNSGLLLLSSREARLIAVWLMPVRAMQMVPLALL